MINVDLVPFTRALCNDHKIRFLCKILTKSSVMSHCQFLVCAGLLFPVGFSPPHLDDKSISHHTRDIRTPEALLQTTLQSACCASSVVLLDTRFSALLCCRTHTILQKDIETVPTECSTHLSLVLITHNPTDTFNHTCVTINHQTRTTHQQVSSPKIGAVVLPAMHHSSQ